MLEGGTAFNRVHGTHAFEYLRLDSRFNDIFNEAMVIQTSLVMNKILESYKGFGNNITRLVHVGVVLGLLYSLNLITSKYPHIQGINFDLPHVINTLLLILLLNKCYNAIPQDEKVIVMDSVIPIIPDTSAATKSVSTRPATYDDSEPWRKSEVNKSSWIWILHLASMALDFNALFATSGLWSSSSRVCVWGD
ncbi:hypothetical protein K1719_041217 [Acacia pycnantha]|nr:hypothetical protein K1719_041217 [Acacia pycnantha]